MGAFDIPNIKDSINKLAQAADLPTIFDINATGQDQLWEVSGADWYKVFGYQFVIINPKDGDKAIKTYTLPIPPQQIAISQVVASQVTPTIGGVVEETSETVFWNISMAGTTGIAISRGDDNLQEFNRQKASTVFRETLSTTGLLSGIAGSVNSAINKVGSVIDGTVDAANQFAQGNIAGGIGEAIGAVNSALLPPIPYSGSAVSADTNGYTEIEEMSKFFYVYNRNKSRDTQSYGLVFKNFKSGQQFRCIVKGFNIQRSAQQPNLYRYTIQLQCWGVKPVGSKEGAEIDRFGPNGDLKSVNTVGIGAKNLLNKISTNSASKGKTNAGMFLSAGGSIL